MADVADQADKHDFTEEMLKRARAAGAGAAVARGRCLNCGEQVEHLYCDEFCKQDFENNQTIIKRTRA